VTSTQITAATQPPQEIQLAAFPLPSIESKLLTLEQSLFHTIGGGVDEFGAQERLESITTPAGAQGKRSVAQCRG
jgi:hypothetical protein